MAIQNNLDQEYKDTVEKAAKEDLNLDIPNSTLEHAIYLTNLLFGKASRTVKILTGSLSEALYGDAVKSIFNQMINKGVMIKLVVWHKAEQNNFLNTLINEFNGKLEIRQANLDYKEENLVRHFLVVDGKSYRLEETHGQQANLPDNFKVKGIVNFNNTKIAQILENTFDTIWKKVPPIASVPLAI